MTLRLGYGTNGFAGHRLADACEVIAGLGYEGVALTLDQPHLDPFADDADAQTAHAKRVLDSHGLASVIETGSRYVLDPWHKHEPTLVSDRGRERRTELLLRAVRIAHELGAEAMSCWSGTLAAGVPDDEAWRRVVDGLGPVLDEADALGVTCCFEPEPGMFVATVADALALRERLGSPELLRLTLDLGHLVCNEPGTPQQSIAAASGLIGNVQVDDMVRGVHDHLPLGTGELDLDTVLDALLATGYDGLACVELPRQAHAAPAVARATMQALRESLERIEKSAGSSAEVDRGEGGARGVKTVRNERSPRSKRATSAGEYSGEGGARGVKTVRNERSPRSKRATSAGEYR